MIGYDRRGMRLYRTGDFGVTATDNDNVLGGCLISQAQTDAASNTIFAVMAKEDQPDENGQQHFNIVALNQRTLQTLAVHEIPRAPDNGPNLILDRGPPRQNSCRLFRMSTVGAIGRGQWLDTDKHLKTER